jgi:hypothetical protein
VSQTAEARPTTLKAISNPIHQARNKVYRRNHLQSVNFMVILFMSRSPRASKANSPRRSDPGQGAPGLARRSLAPARRISWRGGWLGTRNPYRRGRSNDDDYHEGPVANPTLVHPSDERGRGAYGECSPGKHRPSPQAPACGILSGASGNKSKRPRVQQNAGPARQVLW